MKRRGSGRSVLFVLIILTVTLICSLTGLGAKVAYAADIPFYNGLALQYGDANDELYYSGPLTTQTDNITMEAWVNIDESFVPAGQYIRIMYNGNSASSGYGIYFDYSNTTGLIQPCILVGQKGFVYTNPQVYLSKGKWHHLAAVRESGLWKLYVDGVLSGIGDPGAPNIPNTEFSIGNSSYSNENFIGCVDEVRFWTVVRSADDIKNNMYIKLQGNETGLLGYYDLEEAGVIADGNNVGVTSTVTNKASSGSSYNLTLTNFGLNGPTSNFVQSVQLGQFQFENAGYSVGEQEGNVTVAITRTGGNEGSVAINYSTSDGTAVAGTNYTTTNDSVTFASGETKKEINIPVINSGITETKSFSMSLSAQSGVQFGANSSISISVQPNAAEGKSTVIGTGFSYPYGVAVDSSDNIYVAISGSDTVKKIDSTGTVISTWTGFNSPKGVAIDNSGNIYVANYADDTVVKMNSSGETVDTFTFPAVSCPTGVAVDNNNNIYVAFEGDDSIKKIDSSTKVVVDSWTAPGLINDPQGLAVDRFGNIYVASYPKDSVVKINSAGAISTLYCTDTDYYSPFGVAIDRSGNIYISFEYNGKILRIDSNGIVDNTFTAPVFARPQGIAADSSGNLYVADAYDGTVTKLTFSAADTTPPTISSVDITPTSTTNGDVTITVTASDASGIAATGGYSFDGGTTWQDGNSKTYSANTTIAVGSIKVKDFVGNIASYGSEVTINNIDKTTPTISSVDVTPTSRTNGDVTVTVNATDVSGIAATGGFSFDGGVTWQDGNSKTYSANTTIAAGQIQVKNVVGNKTSYGSEVTINNIDKTVPTISSVEASPTSNTNGDVTVTVTASDASGIAATRGFSFDGGITWQDGNSKTYSANTTIAAGQIQVKDIVGNKTSFGSDVTINNIDKTAPAISSVETSPTSTTNGDVTVTVNATDVSGIAVTGGFSFDGGTTWQDGNSKTYSANTTIAAGSIKVKDIVGNTASYGSEVTINNIDKTAPSISSVEASPTSTTNGDVTVTVTASDASGIAATGGYSFDGGVTWQGGNSKTYSENTRIAAEQIQVKDIVGNKTSYGSEVTISNIDKTAPTISSVEASPTSMTNGDVTVTVNATDVSGIAVTGGFSFDGGTTWQDGNSKTYSTNTTIAAGSIKVKDVVGNIASYGSEVTINNIDKTTPTISSVDVTPTSTTNGDVTVTVNAADVSGLAATGGFSFDGGTTWQDGNSKTYSANTTIAAGQIQVKDIAGNKTSFGSDVTINNIDKTAPTISSVEASPTSTTNGDVTVTVNATDVSGIAATGGFSFDGGTTWQDGNSKTYSANTTIAAGSIKVKDIAGNVASYGTQFDIANIDTVLPILTDGAVSRINITDGTVKFTSSKPGVYYYEIVADGAPAPLINMTGTGTECSAGETTIILTSLSDFGKDMYIKVKDAAGNISSALKVDLDGYPSTTANSLNNTVNVNLSSVFKGGSVVIAASGDRQATVSGNAYGDERYIPSAWTSEEAGKSGVFSLNADRYTSVYTTSTAGTYIITAEFVKQQWNGTEWLDVGSDSKTVGLVVREPGEFRLNAVPGDSMVSIEWESVTDAVYYNVYNNNTLLRTLTPDACQCDVANLINGTIYDFIVKAVDNNETVVSVSDEVSATPRTVPGAPTNVVASVGNGEATLTFTSPEDNGGSPITMYIVTSNPGGIMVEGTGTSITVTGLSNGVSYNFTVKAINAAGTGPESMPSRAVTPHRPSSGSSGAPAQPVNPGQTGFEIMVNGKTETAATAVTTKVDDKTVTTVTVDAAKVEEKLTTEGSNAVVTVPINNTADTVVGQLNGQTVKNMEQKEAILEVKTENATYTLPASQINIDDVSRQIGREVQLKDINVNVTIAAPPLGTDKIVEDTANKNNYQVVVKPVEFEITCISGNKTVPVSKFNAYVERMVAIPDGVDPSKITTGVVLNSDGTFSHVPTVITKVDGRYYAKINSLTNSTYSVIWSPKTFKDVEKHWAKDAVNDMGSRLVISGVGNGMFEPGRDVTRGEFAAIVVRALGLMRPVTGKDSFGDVSKNDWYSDAVSIAYENGIISGYFNGEFGPMDKITREQTMTIIARAMKITGLKSEIRDNEVSLLLANYTDGGTASDYAKTGIATCVKTGVITGRNNSIVAPREYITRAEVAVIVQRLLQKSNLI